MRGASRIGDVPSMYGTGQRWITLLYEHIAPVCGPQAGNRAYRSDQYPLARHFYTAALELLLPPGAAAGLHGRSVAPVPTGGIAAAVTAGVALGGVSSDGGGAECAVAAAVAAAVCERGSGAAGAVPRVPGGQRMISALYCSRAAAHVAMRLYPDAVADCCAASAHDEAYAKPWKVGMCWRSGLADWNRVLAFAAPLPTTPAFPFSPSLAAPR